MMDMSVSLSPRAGGIALASALVAGLMASPASAALLLDVAATPRDQGLAYQQTEDDPCIFGNPDCKNPDGFLYPDTPQGSGDNFLVNLWSYSNDKAPGDPGGATDHAWYGTEKGQQVGPFYTSAMLFDALGCTSKDTTCGFFVGFDNNRSTNAQILYEFDIWECNSATGEPNAAGNCTLLATLRNPSYTLTSNFGTGWSDYKFYADGLAFSQSKVYAFNLVYSANDGPDSAFLIRAGSPPDIPEPGIIGLLGIGALGLFAGLGVVPRARRRGTKA